MARIDELLDFSICNIMAFKFVNKKYQNYHKYLSVNNKDHNMVSNKRNPYFSYI